MKAILSIFSFIPVFFQSLIESISDPDPIESPSNGKYTPKCGDYFDINGLEPHQVTGLCDSLFSLGVKGFGLGYPSDRHIKNAKTLWLIEDEKLGLLIYFFSDINPAIKAINEPVPISSIYILPAANVYEFHPGQYDIQCDSSHDKKTAFTNGDEAYRLGLGISDNPYVGSIIDHESADQWLCGYIYARDKQLKTNPLDQIKFHPDDTANMVVYSER